VPTTRIWNKPSSRTRNMEILESQVFGSIKKPK